MYPIDGIVIYINDLNIWDKVGRHQSSGNPLYAVAYKHPDFTMAFKTVVKSITWNVSKAGALKPVVNIETVDTGDCDMENPTGYNAAFISDMKIAKGAEILVTRSGGVIPKILSTISSAPLEEQIRCGMISRCVRFVIPLQHGIIHLSSFAVLIKTVLEEGWQNNPFLYNVWC